MTTTQKFITSVPANFDINSPNAITYTSQTSTTKRLETARRRAREQVTRLDLELEALEMKLDLDTQWDALNPQFQSTLKYINKRAHICALNNLQCLVVQRLFELHRLNLTGIGMCNRHSISPSNVEYSWCAHSGYKARTLLAKSMQKRSKAIRSAVDAYNCAVIALGRTDTLDFDKAAKFGFVEEFDLLCQSQANPRGARWKEPIIREAMKHHQRVKRLYLLRFTA